MGLKHLATSFELSHVHVSFFSFSFSFFPFIIINISFMLIFFL